MVFETFKEFLTPKHFHMFGYTVAVLYLLIGIVFSAVTTVFIARESGNFVCDVRTPDTPSDKDYIRLQCYEKYKQRYSPFPLIGFVLTSFGTMVCVCIAYSFSVKSRIERMEALEPDLEKPFRRRRVTTTRVFDFYFLHLALRFVLGNLSTVLQKKVFYRFGFPMAFDCTAIKMQKPTANQTNSTDDPMISCHSSAPNASWATAIFWINIIFVLLVSGELIYLIYRVNKKKEFRHDFNFCKEHLNLFGKTPFSKSLPKSESIFLDPLIKSSESDEAKFKLDKIFVHGLIYTGRGVKELKEQHKIPDSYLKPQDNAVLIKKLDDLFNKVDDTDKDPLKKILIIGGPGLGKSVLCKKLLQDLRKEKLLIAKEIKYRYSFLFEFKSFKETTKISLKTLLKNVDSWTFQDILDNPEKVFLAFDGLDEFEHRSSLKAEYQRTQAGSASEEMSLSALYTNLLTDNENLLPGATIVTTCRPTELQSVNMNWFCRTVEIMGFTRENVEKYITKLCEPDRDIADRIWRYISANVNLLHLCYIPLICRIICGHLKWVINSQQNIISLPTRLTQIYNETLRGCILTCHKDYKDKEFQGTEELTNHSSLKETLTKLGSLAITGVEEWQEMFRAREVCGMENCGLLHCLPDIKISQYTYQEKFCFIQPTFQNFLAAKEIAKKEPNDLSQFIISNASDPKWHLVIQFVAGLLHGQENEAVDSFVKLLCDSLTAEPPLMMNALLMMRCLYEYNDETTVKRAASELQKNSKFSNRIDLSSCQVTPFDCAAIVHFIKHLELDVLNLSINNLTDQSVSFMCDALRDGNSKLVKLDLSSNKISHRGILHLQDALNSKNCKFTNLNLGQNEITDIGVSHLCDNKNNCNAPCLIDFYCKLTKLNLQNSKITYKGTSDLCDALKNVNSQLTGLNLSYNDIKEQGVWHICDALMDVNCNLTKLYISHIKITDQGVRLLCGALIHPNCKITKLNLSHNSITDQGVSFICDTLKHENCNLTKLYLSKINVTEQSVLYLCETLKDGKCDLVKLNLSYNNIKDVSYLSVALKDVNCNLTVLNLEGNKVTDQGVSHLCDPLKDVNCKLTKVELELNRDITDQGFKMLAEAHKLKQRLISKSNENDCFVM